MVMMMVFVVMLVVMSMLHVFMAVLMVMVMTVVLMFMFMVMLMPVVMAVQIRHIVVVIFVRFIKLYQKITHIKPCLLHPGNFRGKAPHRQAGKCLLHLLIACSQIQQRSRHHITADAKRRINIQNPAHYIPLLLITAKHSPVHA